jgi:hypothetical protein
MGKLVLRKKILRNMIDRVWAPLGHGHSSPVEMNLTNNLHYTGARRF